MTCTSRCGNCTSVTISRLFVRVKRWGYRWSIATQEANQVEARDDPHYSLPFHDWDTMNLVFDESLRDLGQTRVPVGTTVRWVNHDPFTHDVTSGISILGREARQVEKTKLPDGKFSSGLFGKESDRRFGRVPRLNGGKLGPWPRALQR